MWTPLIVKSPGQRTGVVDDRNTQSVDVLPTIAAELGVELPWDDLDGVPVDEADRPPDDKWVDDWEWSEWRSDDGGPVEVDGAEGLARVLAADPVPGSGPRALWDRSDGAYGASRRTVGRRAGGGRRPAGPGGRPSTSPTGRRSMPTARRSRCSATPTSRTPRPWR